MYTEAYAQGQVRVVGFMHGRDPGVRVPATPDWTALDVLRHLTGVSKDITMGRFGGFASDEWTDEQVRSRRDRSFEEVVAEWNDVIGPASAWLDRIDQMDLPEVVPSAAGRIKPESLPAMATGDLLHHEFDLRNAYGDDSGRGIIDVQYSAVGHVKSLRSLFGASDLPTITVEATDSGMSLDVGYGEPVATLRASSFELMRSIGGRRTRDEISAMDWEGDPDRFVDHMTLPHLHMRDTSLNE